MRWHSALNHAGAISELLCVPEAIIPARGLPAMVMDQVALAVPAGLDARLVQQNPSSGLVTSHAGFVKSCNEYGYPSSRRLSQIPSAQRSATAWIVEVGLTPPPVARLVL